MVNAQLARVQGRPNNRSKIISGVVKQIIWKLWKAKWLVRKIIGKWLQRQNAGKHMKMLN